MPPPARHAVESRGSPIRAAGGRIDLLKKLVARKESAVSNGSSAAAADNALAFGRKACRRSVFQQAVILRLLEANHG